MQILKLFSFSMQMQYDIIKLNTGSISFLDKKYKGREKTRNKRKKMKEKYYIPEYKFS